MPRTCPASIGPPETNTEGMFTLAAAISIPGIILSQLPIKMAAWNACARIRISALSAIISREGREYLIPACPIAMPSHTPIEGTITGLPPAAITPSAAALATSFKCICPGIISLCAQIMPTSGFFISESVQPKARSSERCELISVLSENILFIITPPECRRIATSFIVNYSACLNWLNMNAYCNFG